MPTRIPVSDLIGGVSQLPPEQRQPNQLAALDNGISTVTHGLRKRPPTEAVGTISPSTSNFDTAFIHAVNRSDTERYTVVVVDGELKVFDTISGEEQVVVFPHGSDGYLDGGLRGFRAFTVGDHTFVVNRDKVVRRGAVRSVEVPHEALFFFRMADYSTKYTVNIDNFSFVLTTPPDSTADARIEIATNDLAKSMHRQMLAHTMSASFFSQFTVQQFSSTLFIRRIDGKDFVCSASDGLADKGLKLIKGKVQSMEDLPDRAKEGFVVEIVGNPGSPKDNTWVRHEATTDGTGVWRECPAPNIIINLDASTMPHELVRQGYLKESINHAMHRQPIFAQEPGTSPSFYGFSTDDIGTPLGGGATASHFRTGAGGGGVLRSEALTTGTHATQQRRVTVRYEVDTTTAHRGLTADVVLRKNTGSGWEVVGNRTYTAGNWWKDQTWSTVGVFPTGTKFELELVINLNFVAPEADARLVRLTVFGSDDVNRQEEPVPGIRIEAVTNMLLTFGAPDTIWPRGTTFSVTIDAVTLTYLLAADMTTTAACTAFAAVINAHADFTAAYFAPSTAYVSAYAGIAIARADAAIPTFTSASASLNTAVMAWDPNAVMIPGEHVGRIVRNIDGNSEGIITANSVTAIEVGSLTGGAFSLFQPGDRYAIMDTGSSYFVFQQCPWGDRTVGNDEMSKWPSFVDRRISEVFFTAARLGFTAEDFVCLSASSDLYRFWRATVTQVLDDDPIDVQSAHKDVGFLDSAVQWEGQCLLCSSSGHQFSLTGDPVLSPTTVRLDHVSSYPVTARTRPMVSGASVFFPRKSGGYVQLRELFRTRDGLDASLVTAAVPRYIPGDVIDICGDPDHGFIALLPDGGSRNAVYVYTYAPVGDGKQTAWQRWLFPDKVIGIDFFDGYLYLVLYRSGAVKLERINVGNPPADATTHADLGAITYTMTATLSRLYVSDKDGEPIASGRVQIRTVAPQVSSGYVKTTVAAVGKPSKSYIWSTRSKRHPVLAENTAATISLINDYYQGCTITGLEYEVTYSNRSG